MDPLPGPRLSSDRCPPWALGDRTADRKPESEPFGPPTSVGILLIKGFKDAIAERGVDTHAGVDELHDQAARPDGTTRGGPRPVVDGACVLLVRIVSVPPRR